MIEPNQNKDYLEEKSKLIVKNLVFNAFMFFCYFIFDLYNEIFISGAINMLLFVWLLTLTKLKDRNNPKKQVMVTVFLSLINFYFSSQCGFESGIFLYYFNYLLSISLFFDYKQNKKEIAIIYTFVFAEIVLLFVTDFSLFQFDAYTSEIKKNLFIVTIIGVGICSVYYSYLIHIKHQLLLKYVQKTNFISDKLDQIENKKTISETDLKILTDLANNGDKDFFLKFELLYASFCEKLKEKCPDLTFKDLELCAYLKLNYSTKEVALYTKTSVRAVESRKYRIRKKLEIPTFDDINVWMMNFDYDYKLKQISNNYFSTKKIDLQKFAEFSPYPLTISEKKNGEVINVFLNDNFIDEFGYNLRDIPTIKDWFIKAYPDEVYRNEVIVEWGNKVKEKKEYDYVKMKAHVTQKNGRKNWYEIKAAKINDVNIVLFVDIDKEIQLQAELKRINKNNDKILSIIGHDLKTPVANLMSLSSMFKSGDITELEFLKMIQLINEGSTEILGLLDNTLNWAKLNFKEIKTNNVQINIVSITESILDIYKNTIQNKNLKFQLDFNEKFEIYTDVELVTIIIRNTLSNAIKFTPENGIIIVKSSMNTISVTDSGIGMSNERINSILQRNYTSENGTENETGFGIGLQLVMNVCEKLNCELKINSTINKGTEISIIF